METATYTAIMLTVGGVLVIGVLALMVLVRALARDRAATDRAEAAAPPAAAPAFQPEELERAPIGTLTILLVYLVLVAGAWSSVYLLLLRRGG